MKHLHYFFVIFLIFNSLCTYAQDETNAKSDPTATVVGTLDTKLNGTSSLFLWDGDYWTCPDHGTLGLYALDTLTAEISRRIVTPVTINDMEAVAHDDDYFYFGDFGNNAEPERTDLRILRIAQADLLDSIYHFDTIFFTYPDYHPAGSKLYAETDFDCEAMIAAGDSLYLFTKQWNLYRTTCYALPKIPGNHTAVKRATHDVEALVTDACYLPKQRILALCCYNSMAQPVVWLFYDFQGTDFFRGQKVKVHLSNGVGTQTEGISTRDGMHYYLTNEKFSGMGSSRPAQLLQLDLSSYLYDYLYPDTTQHEGIAVPQTSYATVFPNPTYGSVEVQCAGGVSCVEVHDIAGVKVAEVKSNTIDLASLPAGLYFLSITDKRGRIATQQVVKQ